MRVYTALIWIWGIFNGQFIALDFFTFFSNKFPVILNFCIHFTVQAFFITDQFQKFSILPTLPCKFCNKKGVFEVKQSKCCPRMLFQPFRQSLFKYHNSKNRPFQPNHSLNFSNEKYQMKWILQNRFRPHHFPFSNSISNHN